MAGHFCEERLSIDRVRQHRTAVKRVTECRLLLEMKPAFVEIYGVGAGYSEPQWCLDEE